MVFFLEQQVNDVPVPSSDGNCMHFLISCRYPIQGFHGIGGIIRETCHLNVRPSHSEPRWAIARCMTGNVHCRTARQRGCRPLRNNINSGIRTGMFRYWRRPIRGTSGCIILWWIRRQVAGTWKSWRQGMNSPGNHILLRRAVRSRPVMSRVNCAACLPCMVSRLMSVVTTALI